MVDTPQDPPDTPPSVTPAEDTPQLTAETGVVLDFAARSRVQEGKPVIDPALAVPETKLPTKLSKHQLQVRRAQRRAAAYELWLQDVDYKTIGQALGVSGKTAFYYVQAYAQAINRPHEQSVLAKRDKYVTQLARVKRTAFLLASSPQVLPKDRAAAMQVIINATHEQGQLGGVHMPVKVASTTPDGLRWAPIAVEQLVEHFSLEELRGLEKARRLELRLPAANAAVVDAELTDDADPVSAVPTS